MSELGVDLIQSLNEAPADTRGEGPATAHERVIPRELRKQVKLAQVRLGAPMGV